MSLPPKGLDHEKFAVSFQSGKILVTPKDKGDIHYILHLSGKSGTIDFHETIRGVDGQKRYRTLFSMRKHDLEQLLCEITLPAIQALTGILRPLRVGWLHHRRIAVVTGLLPTEQEIPGITRMRKKRRLAIDEQAFLSNIRVPEFLEEILEEPDRVFTLIAMKRRIPRQVGFGFKVTEPSGNPRLFWVKMPDLSAVVQRLQSLFIQTASRYSIVSSQGSKMRSDPEICDEKQKRGRGNRKGVGSLFLRAFRAAARRE